MDFKQWDNPKTSNSIEVAMNKMLESFGFPLITVEKAKQYIGNVAKNFVLRSLPENEKDKVEEALKVYNSIYNASGSPYTCLYEGIADLLACLSKAGVLLAIVYNKPQPSTDEVYKKYLVTLDGDLTEDMVKAFAEGICLKNISLTGKGGNVIFGGPNVCFIRKKND